VRALRRGGEYALNKVGRKGLDIFRNQPGRCKKRTSEGGGTDVGDAREPTIQKRTTVNRTSHERNSATAEEARDIIQQKGKSHCRTERDVSQPEWMKGRRGIGEKEMIREVPNRSGGLKEGTYRKSHGSSTERRGVEGGRTKSFFVQGKTGGGRVAEKRQLRRTSRWVFYSPVKEMEEFYGQRAF